MCAEDLKKLKERIKEKSLNFGFSTCGVLRLGDGEEVFRRLENFLSKGYHGEMDWLAKDREKRSSPLKLWPEARSALVFSMNYHSDLSPLERIKNREIGVISTYALGRDYHDVFKGKLKNFASWLVKRTGDPLKVFVDTAPLMEKPLGVQAGIGWQGKHTNLVSKSLGSWTFLGIILTTLPLEPDDGEKDHCGSCRACLDICPTQAFPSPYQLDARRCLSYLTIEYKGHIPEEFRRPMGNRIYGCDDCLAVCPWNKFAQLSREVKFFPREDLVSPPLLDLAKLDDGAFRRKFSASPVKRIGRDRFVRNVLIALGNGKPKGTEKVLEGALEDHSPLVRAMAVWALGELSKGKEKGSLFSHLKAKYAPLEKDQSVVEEWAS